MKPLIIILAIALAGCTSNTKPDKLIKAHAEAKKHGVEMRANIGTAKAKLKEAKAAHDSTIVGHGEATKLVNLIVPAVDSLALRVPDEFKPEVNAMKMQVAELNLVIERTTGSLGDTATAMNDADQRLNLAEWAGAKWEAKQHEIETKLTPEFLREVGKLAEDKANAQRNAVIAYMVAGVATLGCAVLGYLLLKP